MKRAYWFSIFILCSSWVICQDDYTKDVVSPIIQLFDGMRAGDSTMIADLFISGAQLSSIVKDSNGKTVKRSTPIESFITAVGSPHTEVWDEQIWSYDVQKDGPMAYVWTEYTFYRGDQLSHCGFNMFELMNTERGWKISAITDTRRRDDCKEKSSDIINKTLDMWHSAAAIGDEEVFFGSMTEDAVFIGTDETERWTREELRSWSKEYFDKDSAWAFTPISREVILDENGQLAWFDELLNTWMGVCRASGVMVKENESWKIRHYHLSIAVPNDVVEGYLELIGKSRD